MSLVILDRDGREIGRNGRPSPQSNPSVRLVSFGRLFSLRSRSGGSLGSLGGGDHLVVGDRHLPAPLAGDARELAVRVHRHRVPHEVEHREVGDGVGVREALGEVEAVALSGEAMPQKSTYFYPKTLDGLVIRTLDGPG